MACLRLHKCNNLEKGNRTYFCGLTLPLKKKKTTIFKKIFKATYENRYAITGVRNTGAKKSGTSKENGVKLEIMVVHPYWPCCLACSRIPSSLRNLTNKIHCGPSKSSALLHIAVVRTNYMHITSHTQLLT